MNTVGANMSKRSVVLAFAVLVLMGVPLAASLHVKAGDDVAPGTVYDQKRGELSPGTSAPARQQMVNAIKSASPTALYAMLEYGERVECYECIPLLEQKLLSSDDAQVREISAWWLRRRSFGFGPVMVNMQRVIATHEDPVMRARAAEALGEFLDPNGLPALTKAARQDADQGVRLAAVRGLTRLNAPGSRDALRTALSDADERVRLAALTGLAKVNFFRDEDSVVARLGDDSTNVRRAAAQLAGERRITAAAEGLVDLLQDDAPTVRQAAAIALGRIGGGDALEALAAAEVSEKHDGVLDAIDIAQRMR
jgi:HEAT repeats